MTAGAYANTGFRRQTPCANSPGPDDFPRSVMYRPRKKARKKKRVRVKFVIGLVRSIQCVMKIAGYRTTHGIANAGLRLWSEGVTDGSDSNSKIRGESQPFQAQ